MRLAAAGTHMGKVLIQVGASEEARAAMRAGVPSGKTLVLPRSNVPEDLAPKEEQKPAKEGKADAEKESKPEVGSAQLPAQAVPARESNERQLCHLSSYPTLPVYNQTRACLLCACMHAPTPDWASSTHLHSQTG